jgi:hypothetical protein
MQQLKQLQWLIGMQLFVQLFGQLSEHLWLKQQQDFYHVPPFQDVVFQQLQHFPQLFRRPLQHLVQLFRQLLQLLTLIFTLPQVLLSFS